MNERKKNFFFPTLKYFLQTAYAHKKNCHFWKSKSVADEFKFFHTTKCSFEKSLFAKIC